MVKIPRRPIRGAVVQVLRDLSLLWGRPPDLEKHKAAGAGTEAAKGKNTQRSDYTSLKIPSRAGGDQ